jgi:GMP synthase-like glutamine amidotransferase
VQELARPYLGVCLGHQLLADALGGRAGRAERMEVGLLDIDLNETGRKHQLFSGFGQRKRAIQWHGAEVLAVPEDGVVLASSVDCPISAFCVGPVAFGIQYHVEATDQSIGDWAASPPSSEMLKRLHGASAGPRLRAEVAAAMGELRSNSRRFYDNFMDIARRHLAAYAE